MKIKSLENTIENSWNFIKDLAQKPSVRKSLAFLTFITAYNALNNKINAQTTSVLDSLFLEYGHDAENRGPHGIGKALWELKDGVPTFMDTLDFGILYAGKGIPDLTNGSGFGVDYQTSKWDTVLVKGKIYRYPENTPLEGAGFNIYGGTGQPVWGNYLYDPEYTNEKGEFHMALRIKVRSIPPEIDSLITVLNPNKGEVLEPGSTQQVTWKTDYFPQFNFDILYSSDAGKNWNVAAVVAGQAFEFDEEKNIYTWKYDWKIPETVSSDSCLIKIMDNKKNNLYDISDSLFTIGKGTGIKSESLDDKIPDEFMLYQNYPNPFNAGTTIKYDLNQTAKNVELNIYNQLGELMLKAKELPTNAGAHRIHWDGKKENGSTVTSGVYFYDLIVDDKRTVKTMILLK